MFKETGSVKMKKGAQIHPGCWYQYSIPAPFPGTHIQPVHNPETEADFLSKNTNKKRRPPTVWRLLYLGNVRLSMLKTPRRLCEKTTIEMDHVWGSVLSTPVSYVVDAASLEHRRSSSMSCSDVHE